MSSAEEAPPASYRVLLLDDNDAARLTLAALFEEEGFSVTEVSSLTEARRSLAAGTEFDLVLLDRHLSDGQGTDLIPRLRAQLPRCRVIVVSGTDDRRVAALAEPADAYFAKGDDPSRLLEEIHRLVPRR